MGRHSEMAQTPRAGWRRRGAGLSGGCIGAAMAAVIVCGVGVAQAQTYGQGGYNTQQNGQGGLVPVQPYDDTRGGQRDRGGDRYDGADDYPRRAQPDRTYRVPAPTPPIETRPAQTRNDDRYLNPGRDYRAPEPRQRDAGPAREWRDPDGPRRSAAPRYDDRDRGAPRGQVGRAYEEPPRQSVPPQAYDDGTYTIDEITGTGHAFFGSISKGLAEAIEYAFQRAGRPNGYILGQEAGGAFVAGLRYGEGTLYTKNAGRHPIYWQGPTIGYDFGGEGSRVMVLVYGLPSISAAYRRFAGIGGSAYLVGGVGVTFHAHNQIKLAPIRSGVGLRLGANVGYLKMTRRPTWNPF